MWIKNLSIRQFRNITEMEFVPGDVLNVIYGNNAQGKTSIIETIYFLSTAKSFRTASHYDLIQKNSNGFQVESLIKPTEGEEFPIKAKLLERDGAHYFLDSKPVSKKRFIGHIRTVIFAPESLTAVKSGPGERRDLVDDAIFQISEEAAHCQSDFTKILKQRNACLKQIKSGELEFNQGLAVLESLDPLFLNSAAALTFQRLSFLDQISNTMGYCLSQILGEKIILEILYKSSDEIWTQRTNKNIFERINAELSNPEKRKAELALGTTLSGPHRHDIAFVFNGNDSRIFCSQGQQRAIILAFKLAEIMFHYEAFGTYPILLLDDVLSEFDNEKQTYLINFLRTKRAQTFLTTTAPTLKLEDCRQFFVKEGQILEGSKNGDKRGNEIIYS